VARWKNWSGRHRAEAHGLHFLRSEADAAALTAQAAAEGLKIRAAGAGHSHAPLVPTEGVIVDTSGLSGLIAVDAAARRATVWAGTPVYALGRVLHEVGLGLPNQGDIDRQSIGGAVSTGTHGSGRELKNLSACVVGARIAVAGGELLDCGPELHPDAWHLARLGLGAAGILTRLQLQLRPAYRLRERSWSQPFEEIRPRIAALVAESRHFEFFWYPSRDRAIAKAIDETADEPEYPLAAEGERVAWSYEVLPNHRPLLHTEMEYSVPAEHGAECMSAIRELYRTQFPDVVWPVEYRTLAADDVWLSTAYERPTVTISAHQDIELDEAPLFRACEEIFLGFEGRPHWGKLHYLEAEQLAGAHPRWRDWWAARDRLDPGEVFLNDYLAGLRPGD
jgi:FAD/FMN-containing dehydrogenase